MNLLRVRFSILESESVRVRRTGEDRPWSASDMVEVAEGVRAEGAAKDEGRGEGGGGKGEA